MFLKVPLFTFLFAGELPPAACAKHCSYDEEHGATRLFRVSASESPKKRCYYIVAVTPEGEREKFYAWILPLDLTIKAAFKKGKLENK